jgi:hypothetical protein
MAAADPGKGGDRGRHVAANGQAGEEVLRVMSWTRWSSQDRNGLQIGTCDGVPRPSSWLTHRSHLGWRNVVWAAGVPVRQLRLPQSLFHTEVEEDQLLNFHVPKLSRYPAKALSQRQDVLRWRETDHHRRMRCHTGPDEARTCLMVNDAPAAIEGVCIVSLTGLLE